MFIKVCGCQFFQSIFFEKTPTWNLNVYGWVAYSYRSAPTSEPPRSSSVQFHSSKFESRFNRSKNTISCASEIKLHKAHDSCLVPNAAIILLLVNCQELKLFSSFEQLTVKKNSFLQKLLTIWIIPGSFGVGRDEETALPTAPHR